MSKYYPVIAYSYNAEVSKFTSVNLPQHNIKVCALGNYNKILQCIFTCDELYVDNLGIHITKNQYKGIELARKFNKPIHFMYKHVKSIEIELNETHDILKLSSKINYIIKKVNLNANIVRTSIKDNLLIIELVMDYSEEIASHCTSNFIYHSYDRESEPGITPHKNLVESLDREFSNYKINYFEGAIYHSSDNEEVIIID